MTGWPWPSTISVPRTRNICAATDGGSDAGGPAAAGVAAGGVATVAGPAGGGAAASAKARMRANVEKDIIAAREDLTAMAAPLENRRFATVAAGHPQLESRPIANAGRPRTSVVWPDRGLDLCPARVAAGLPAHVPLLA